jgi:hypothetical protein
MPRLIKFLQLIHREGYVCEPYRETTREPKDALQYSQKELTDLYVGRVPPEIVLANLGNPDREYLFVSPRSELVDTRDIAGSGLCVFRNFVDCDPTSEGAVQFTEAYGFLGNSAHNRTPTGFFLSEWLRGQKSMRDLVLKFEEGGVSSISEDLFAFQQAKFSGHLELGGVPQYVLQPPSLWAYMWLELGLHISNQTGIRKCEWCGTWFPYGTGTSRRSKAKFCADKCRKASHVRQKRERMR